MQIAVKKKKKESTTNPLPPPLKKTNPDFYKQQTAEDEKLEKLPDAVAGSWI